MSESGQPNLERFKTVYRFRQGSLEGVAVKNDYCEARFVFRGAQLLSFSPSGKEPWFWVSRQADFSGDSAIRGGIPVCMPWFGKLDRNPAAIRNQTRGESPPNHGFMRNSDWQLISVEENRSETVLCFELQHNENNSTWWPYYFVARVEYVLGETLAINLSYRNLSETGVYLSCALHSYFSISDLGLTVIRGLENTSYIDTLDYWREKEQQGELVINSGIDRIYTRPPSRLLIEDQGWGRNLELQSFNSGSVVVWNPWDKTGQTNQLADGEFLRFVCVETANVLDDCVYLEPNDIHQLSLSISESQGKPALL